MDQEAGASTGGDDEELPLLPVGDSAEGDEVRVLHSAGRCLAEENAGGNLSTNSRPKEDGGLLSREDARADDQACHCLHPATSHG